MKQPEVSILSHFGLLRYLYDASFAAGCGLFHTDRTFPLPCFPFLWYTSRRGRKTPVIQELM